MEINPKTRIIDLTVEQLVEVITKAKAPVEKSIPEQETKYEYGIAGIAKIFNCSIRTANRIKQSGRISQAITQIGRMIVIDVNRALELYNK